MQLTTDALLEAVRAWVDIESPTNHVAGVNRVADQQKRCCAPWGQVSSAPPGATASETSSSAASPASITVPASAARAQDTVHQPGTFSFRRDGDRAYGPGIYDMKGGNAMAFSALAALHAQGRRPRLGVSVMMIPDEEVGSPTSRVAIEAEALRHKVVLVVEPAGEGGKVTIARHGIARWHLRTIGRPAHAGAYHAEGRSAVREMAHHILVLEALTDHARNFFVNIGIVQGGTHENMVPAECTAICYALVPTATEQAALRAAVMSLPRHDPDVTTEVTEGLGRPPFSKSPAIQALYDHALALSRETGFEVKGERVAGGGSDGNFTGALGVPTLDGLGVVGGGPHTREEWIDLACLVPRTRLLMRLFETLGPGVAGL